MRDASARGITFDSVRISGAHETCQRRVNVVAGKNHCAVYRRIRCFIAGAQFRGGPRKTTRKIIIKTSCVSVSSVSRIKRNKDRRRKIVQGRERKKPLSGGLSANKICRKIRFVAEDIFPGNEFTERRPRRMCIRLNALLQNEECRRYLTWNLRKRRPLSPSNARRRSLGLSSPFFFSHLKASHAHASLAGSPYHSHCAPHLPTTPPSRSVVTAAPSLSLSFPPLFPIARSLSLLQVVLFSSRPCMGKKYNGATMRRPRHDVDRLSCEFLQAA